MKENLTNDSDLYYEKEAFKMLQDAACKGNEFAQLYLGFCYSYGVGVVDQVDKEKADLKAIKWLRRAASQGNKDARRELKLVYWSIEDDDELVK